MIGGSFLNFDFEEYTLEPKVGIGAVDVNKLFFFEEKTINNVQSWYIFFDPTCVSSVDALITFSSTITGFDRSTAALSASNSVFGKDNYTDVYGSVRYTGLERKDIAIYEGNKLEIHWRAGDPGDHLRVYTMASQAPEPSSVALSLAGLGVMGWVHRRRRAATALRGTSLDA